MEASFITTNDKPTLQFERRLAHPPEAVWAGLTDSTQLEQWFPTAVTFLGPLEAGTAIEFSFPQQVLEEQPMTLSGEVLEAAPPRRLAFTWGGDALHFELEPAEGGTATRLRLSVAIDDRDKAARDGAGWQVCLDRLELTLAGGSAQAPGSEPGGEWRGYYEEYRRRGFPAGAPVPPVD